MHNRALGAPEIFKRPVKSSRLGLLLAVLLALGAAATPRSSAFADPQLPVRQKSLLVHYTTYTWWLLGWGDNQVLCSLVLDHEGLPTHPEIRQTCGGVVYQDWVATEPCDTSIHDFSTCKGLYLHLQSSTPATRTVIVDLPEPTVHINLGGCNPQPPEYICNGHPMLVLTGIEPLANESIVGIRGMLDGLPFYCPSDRCELPLRQTPSAGIEVVFRGESSFGDSTDNFTALVRAVPVTGGSSLFESSYIDVLSSQWRGTPPASCSITWDSLPPPGGLPTWLTTPAMADQLITQEPYNLLAGILISNGLTEADQCSDGGLLSSGGASACGLEASRSIVIEWQNRFDKLIINTAQARGVPAQLMKNLFAVESQFWPGIYEGDQEVGLGQLTENGADTTLLWNSDFYTQFCPLVLQQGVCAKGYVHLLPGEQAMLRGALVLRANASCAGCPLGIDLSRADFSIEIFAETLLANCEQVGRMVRNTTHEQPGRVVEYEDLWRFTLSNYNAGPGCLSMALRSAWDKTGQLTWTTVSDQFSPVCRPTVEYVERISHPPVVNAVES